MENVRVLVCVFVPAAVEQRLFEAPVALADEYLGVAANFESVAKIYPFWLPGHLRMVRVEGLRGVERVR